MAMMNNLVPPNWANVAYPSLKPLASWYNDFLERISFMRKWLHDGAPNVFWFGGFFFPQGFMTATKQNFARKYSQPIDALGFDFKVLNGTAVEEVTEPADDGVFCTGMYFDGARWDDESCAIADARPAENWTPMRIVQFLPEMDHKANPAFFACPVYKTSTRSGQLSTTGMSTNFVVNVELPCAPGVPPQKWVLAGVGCVLNLND